MVVESPEGHSWFCDGIGCFVLMTYEIISRGINIPRIHKTLEWKGTTESFPDGLLSDGKPNSMTS